MAVDTSIYNALAPRVKSVAEFDAEAQDAQMRKQNMLMNALGIQQRQHELAQAQQRMTDARAEREQMAGLGQWLAAADTKAPDFAAQVYQRAPMAAGGFLKDLAARDKDAAAAGKSRADMEKEQLAATKTRLDLILQATSSAKDQASYTQARNLLESNGIDVTSIPKQFDPAYVAAAGQQAMTQAQRLEQVWKQKGYDLDVRRADDMVRHQRATEGLQARGQDMSAASQAAARAQAERQFNVSRADRVAGTAPAEKPATESERTAGFLLQRIRDSQRQLNAVTGQNPGSAKPGVIQETARLVSEPLANTITGADRQQVEAAQLDILDAALTLGTGAAYTREQLNGYRKSYFPQLGDKPDAVKEKAARLNNLIKAAEVKAGRSAADVNPPAPPQGAPKLGAVQDGYRFKGGNPADPKSWEKM